MTELVRPLSSIAWELRAAWARGLRVSVSLDGCDLERVEGVVRGVSATGATALVGALRVPLHRVLAVHRPSRLGDSTVRGGRWSGPRPAALAVHEHQQALALEATR